MNLAKPSCRPGQVRRLVRRYRCSQTDAHGRILVYHSLEVKISIGSVFSLSRCLRTFPR